ncbi:LPS assembly protein LptD [Frigidibacter sp. MR17.14]|uniref:LPS-assembly protein LptD n=1 Tax=Frigidibacter sp. MR17.14 TaxID=3126509 RepID=UPI003012B0CC
MRRFAFSALAALLLGTAIAAYAQDTGGSDAPASLVADTVFVDPDGKLTATGHVEVFQGSRRLSADKVVYDPDSERIAIDGPITMIEADGSEIILADEGDLSRDMSDGILKGARMVLDRQLQISANELARVDSRYTRATRVRASSCEVCASNPTPLWEIRATRVTHDTVEKQIYYENAQFRVVGVPVFWTPRLRTPDPTVERARGFLAPSIRATTSLGTGVKLPYFIPLGADKDITLTPYLSAGTRTVELRYRQAFRRGSVEFNGAFTRDDLESDTRGYLFGSGSFRLPADYRLSFGVQYASDASYLSDYGYYDDVDRLTNSVAVSRVRRNEYILGTVRHYETLRNNEKNATIPSVVTDTLWHRRFAPALLGGEGGLKFTTHTHRRSSGEDVIGRDVASSAITGDWRRNWVLSNGMVVSSLADLTADIYRIGDDSTYDDTISRGYGTLGVELRWPFLRAATEPDGSSWLVEPIAQLAWSPRSGAEVPNEDSTLVEFDEGNLFSLDRYPGSDAYERGLRANLGVGVTRLDMNGSTFNLTFGRVFRSEDLDQFSTSTGLDGVTSDWMVFTQYAADWGFSVSNRAVVSDGMDFSRDELRVIWNRDKLDLGTSYTWLAEDAEERRNGATSELAVDAAWDVSDRWRTTLQNRYDFEANRASKTKIGLQYFTECVTVELSASRRYTSSDTVRPTTSFNLGVELAGFGANTRGNAALRRCSG